MIKAFLKKNESTYLQITQWDTLFKKVLWNYTTQKTVSQLHSLTAEHKRASKAPYFVLLASPPVFCHCCSRQYSGTQNVTPTWVLFMASESSIWQQSSRVKNYFCPFICVHVCLAACVHYLHTDLMFW